MFYKGIMKRGLYVMNRKIWGVLLSVVLFAMYPLPASAAPMTEAPVTSDQMVQISNGPWQGLHPSVLTTW